MYPQPSQMLKRLCKGPEIFRISLSACKCQQWSDIPQHKDRLAP
jgi:hypothetical protein